MPLGEIVYEAKAKFTSVKVQPFDGSGQGVRLEFNHTSEFSGKIHGTAVATTYSIAAPDGTNTSKGYGIITTNDGESITVEAWGIGSPPTRSGSQSRGAVSLRTSSHKYAWVNTTPFAYEAEISADGTGFSLILFEWK
jgi:hypothetical protein